MILHVVKLGLSLQDFTVTTVTWLIVTEYLCHILEIHHIRSIHDYAIHHWVQCVYTRLCVNNLTKSKTHIGKLAYKYTYSDIIKIVRLIISLVKFKIWIFLNIYEKLRVTKGVIRRCSSQKNRKHNNQKKGDRETNNNRHNTHTWLFLMCSGR